MKHFQNKHALSYLLLIGIALLTAPCKKAIYAPAAGDTINLSALPMQITPGESVDVSITVTGIKANGQPMPDNTLVRLSADSGTFHDNNNGDQVEAVLLTGGRGKAKYKLDETFTGESVVIAAQSGSAVVTPEQLIITITDITTLYMTAHPLTLGPAGGTTTITVTAYDGLDQVVPGKKIFLETTAGTLTPSSPIVTGANGEIRAELQTGEPASVTATYKEIAKTIEINIGVNQPPEAGFEFSPQNPLMGETVYFVSTSTDSDGTIDLYRWSFGDGSDVSNEEHPPHDFPVTAEAKEYQVVLTVTDDGGVKSSVAQTVAFAIEENAPPEVDFVFSPTTPVTGDTVYFNAEASTDPDGTIKSYYWDFGDDSTEDQENSPNVSHPYNPPVTTTYTVTLRVVDNDGAEGVVSKEVTVEVTESENQPPTAAFSFSPTNPRAGAEVRFNAEGSTDPDGEDDIDRYEWDFGDGTEPKPEGKEVSHAYEVNEETTFTVTLRVVDKKGDEGVATAEITVLPSPVAAFAFSPGEPLAGEVVTFDASTSQGDIVYYMWYFGDGTSKSRKNAVIQHTYSNAKTYLVTLTVTDINNRKSDISIQVKIN